MSVAVDSRGLKRVCIECGVRFYDLNKRPIICPGCATEFDPIGKTKSRRGKAVVTEVEVKDDVKEAKQPAEDKKEEIENDNGDISLEEAAALEEADADEDDADADLGDLDIDNLDDEDLDDLDSVEDDDD